MIRVSVWWGLVITGALLLAGCAGDGDADPNDLVATDTVRSRFAPVNSHAPCVAAGWTWFHDSSTSYCPNQPDVGGDPHCETSFMCFCALPCESDADCAGLQQHWCRPVALFDGSDASSCRDDRRICTSDAGSSEDHCVWRLNYTRCE